MTTRALEDGAPGGCQATMPRQATSSRWPPDSQEPEAEGSSTGRVEARLKKTDQEPEATLARRSGKEKMKAGATPRSPARKRTQPAPPLQPPPPPPAVGEELPWGDLSLNKCLVLASLLALLGWAVQLCRDSVTWEVSAPAPVPEPWVPPSSAPKEPELPQPKPGAGALPAGLPETQRAAERAAVPRSREAAEKDQGKAGGDAGEEPEPRARRGPTERPRAQRPRKEKRRWEQTPRKEKPRKPREPPERREARLGRREAQGGAPGPRARVPGDPGPRRRQAWASEEEEDRPPGRQKHRPGKGWN